MVWFCIKNIIDLRQSTLQCKRKQHLQFLSSLLTLPLKCSHNLGKLPKHNKHTALPCWVKIEANAVGSWYYAVSWAQIIINGSRCWTDAVCYVGRRGGQGAHVGMRCEGGALGPQRRPVDPVGSMHNYVWKQPPFVLFLSSYLCFSFTSLLSFCLSLPFCSTDTLTWVGTCLCDVLSF